MDGVLPRLVIGHRTFDAEVAAVVIGDDEVKRLGRFGVGHAPAIPLSFPMIKDVIMRKAAAAGGVVTLKIKWRGFLKIIWRRQRHAGGSRLTGHLLHDMLCGIKAAGTTDWDKL